MEISQEHPQVKSKRRTMGQRAADVMTQFLGSWVFIISFLIFLVAWIIVNILAWELRWDPYPFILLNLTLSSVAALQAPIIMMSQNRQTERDRQQAAYDYAIDRKAEKEVEEVQIELQKIQRKLDKILAKKS